MKKQMFFYYNFGGEIVIKCSLAVDIGASNGKLIAGYIEHGKLKIKELHRFKNQIKTEEDNLFWDMDILFSEVKKGIHKCVQENLYPESIGIDTWAVDFILLDEQNLPCTKAISYRDTRTEGIMEEVFEIIDKQQLYSKTGIQFLKFNTIYQLYAIRKNTPEIFKKAKSFLMIPDYLNFLLTGKKVNEYTNASTTQLLNPYSKKWDKGILEKLGINPNIFLDIMPPNAFLGPLKEELVKEFGFDMKVILPATHDTASAVVSVPDSQNTIYISSGTWSLIGTENNKPIINDKALNYNFTNEGGMDYRYRFLKNIMGLWMIQEVKRHYKDKYSFNDLTKLAQNERDFNAIVNVNDDRFLKPKNIIYEIQSYCKETKQQIPKTVGEIAKCVFDSLVKSYEDAIYQIEEICQKSFDKINIIGGGAQNKILNQLLANKTGKIILAGPTEATSIGNIVSQLISLGKIENLKSARKLIYDSFTVEKYIKE